MPQISRVKNQFRILLMFVLSALWPVYAVAGDNYSSQLVNESNQSGSQSYDLVKTRVWPEVGCVIDSGQANVNPGDSAVLTIKKSPQCSEAGVGYSLYKSEDKKKEHLLGYVAHRFRDGKYSLQVSIFCVGDKCLFRDLNPLQTR
jgi:hypothetical protein